MKFNVISKNRKEINRPTVACYLASRLLLLLLFLLCTACTTQRVVKRQAAVQYADSLRLTRYDSLRWKAGLRMSMEQTLCLREIILSPPNSTGGQYVERVRLLTSEAKATGSASEERRQSTSATAEGIRTAGVTTVEDSRKESKPWGLPAGWWWMAIAGVGVAGISYRMYARSRAY